MIFGSGSGGWRGAVGICTLRTGEWLAFRNASARSSGRLYDLSNPVVALDELPGRPGDELQLRRHHQYSEAHPGPGLHTGTDQHANLPGHPGADHVGPGLALRQCAQ